MNHNNPSTPRQYKGVMVSSTFRDLEQHRNELMKALQKEELFPIGMENYVPVPGEDIISSSLNMVRKSSGYIGLISHRYGQVLGSDSLNPHGYSVTRLEFEEAQRLGLPTLVFVMSDKHPGTKADFETDAEKLKKLEAFREHAKAGRIYVEFDNLEDFIPKAIHAVASLRRYLEEQDELIPEQPPVAPAPIKPDPIPTPPAFYAEPPYIGSHQFVGRQAQLDALDDWAAVADPHPILLFEAIGGTGKSMLTWQWTTKHATSIRSDWAGRFWYSFYERGAVMADFCQRALAYMTGRPLADFRKKKTLELGEWLLHELQARPWLLILDGLERVLVAYHRFDAAQLRDEEAGTSDQIAQRDPCAAIRPEDDDLLRKLAAAAPSKLLLTSRLTPRVLLNPSSQAIPGVLRVPLPGLRPADAAALIRACGVTGDSQAIQDYLKRHCDCHPLVTGVLAGLINDYLPDRGNFDAWVADANHGRHLNLANLDLVQKRNHILHAALDALPEKSRQLLSTLALLSEAVDYPTLSALNPHLPPEPEKVEVPEKPEGRWRWERMSDDEKEQAQQDYQAALQRRKEYEQALTARLQSPEYHAAPQDLTKTVRDLERRSLLQYDALAKRHDLHPVVRGIAAGGLRQEEKEQYGQRVVDHFSQQAHNPYEEAETLEDLRIGLHIVHALLQMGNYQQAWRIYDGDLANALFYNLEAYSEILSILRPFCLHGWATLPPDLSKYEGRSLITDAAIAFKNRDELSESLTAYSNALLANLWSADWMDLCRVLYSISDIPFYQDRLAKQERCLLLACDLAALMHLEQEIFCSRLGRFQQLTVIGQKTEAEVLWQALEPMGRNWARKVYRSGNAEYAYALFLFWQGELREVHLTSTEQLAKAGKNRGVIRNLHRLRGEWQLEQGHWARAAESLHEAVRMAREIGQTDATTETAFTLAKFHLNQLTDPHHEAKRLAQAKQPAHRFLAELWLAIGDREQATKHALAAYKWAWADGEPYVHRYELDKTTELLQRLGAAVPKLLPYDPATYVKFPWEDEVAAAIERLRAEKEAKQAQERAQ